MMLYWKRCNFVFKINIYLSSLIRQEKNWGGSQIFHWTYARGGGGVIQMRTVCNKGGGGV